MLRASITSSSTFGVHFDRLYGRMRDRPIPHIPLPSRATELSLISIPIGLNIKMCGSGIRLLSVCRRNHRECNGVRSRLAR